MTKAICKEDVLQIAKDLQMEITDEKITQVLEDYDDWAKDRPCDLWFQIVEDILYSMVE